MSPAATATKAMGDGWYTLTSSEWNYLFSIYNRTTTSGIRYAKATVNGFKGVILLPDDWSTDYYTLYSANTTDASFTANKIDATTWTNSLEAHGAVFLPATGYRYGEYVWYFDNPSGNYWSSSSYSGNVDQAYYLDFTERDLHPQYSSNSRAHAYAVRLVRNVP